MPSGNRDKGQDFCCRQAGSLPVVIDNPPGQPQIAYRAGNFAHFKRAMIERLSASKFPALKKFTTRNENDFSVALVDAWAIVSDVLTFYQERIANESYLGTATERYSVLQLAALTGYEPNPGVAANTYLAFVMESAPGAPQEIEIATGTKVQSIPGQDEKPQIFETIAKIKARPEWNAMRPQLKEFRYPKFGDQTVFLKGIGTNLKTGDTLLFVGEEREKDPGNENWEFRRVKAVSMDPQKELTAVTLDAGLGSSIPYVKPPQKSKVYALRQRASLFGHNAPDWRVMSNSVKAQYLGLPSDTEVSSSITEWPDFSIADISNPPYPTAPGTGLYGEYFDGIELKNRKFSRTDAQINFDWGSGSPDPVVGTDYFSIRWTGWVRPKTSGDYAFYTVSDDGVRLWVNGHLIINNWTDHAETQNKGTVRLEAGRLHDLKLEYYERGGLAKIMLLWQGPDQPKGLVPQECLYPRDIRTVHLDNIYSQIVAGSWVVLSIPEYQEVYEVETTVEDSVSRFTLTGKTTRLALKGENLRELFNEKIRETSVFAQSDPLGLADIPIDLAVSGSSIVLERKMQGLKKDQMVALSGELPDGTKKNEILKILEVASEGSLTKLVFTSEIKGPYKRETVALNANVAPAAHGETVQEILGSGNAGLSYQSFFLRQPPLTYVPASTPSGNASTLEIRVNDVLWHEVPTFMGHGPNERIYVTRITHDGQTRVQFGDGVSGSRPQTGQNNIQAKYRKGIGAEGSVKAGQLSLLLSRPLGLKEVTNPADASGGADPESLSEARKNASLRILTLERIVSLQDYEHFARAFSGVAKALATWTWSGENRGVFITVAGAKGEKIEPGSRTYDYLLSAMEKAGDPNVPFRLKSYLPAYFKIDATILVDPDLDPVIMLEEVKKGLREQFCFDNRSFGQTVSLSEITAAMHSVPGILMVNVNELKRIDGQGGDGRVSPLAAAYPKPGSDMDITPAELLMIDMDSTKLIVK